MTSADAAATTRIGLFGDSIAAGLGVKEYRYGVLVAQSLQATLVDFASSAATVKDSLAAFEADLRTVDIALIGHGITEAILRPEVSRFIWLPRRWRRPGWMDPRPYYSTRLRRRVSERIESSLRWRIKNLLIRKGGAIQFVSAHDYADALDALVRLLGQQGCGQIFILEPTHISERFFPGSNEAMLHYATVAKARVSGVTWIRTRSAVREEAHYLLDDFHPNREGHQAMASLITKIILGQSWGNQRLLNGGGL